MDKGKDSSGSEDVGGLIVALGAPKPGDMEEDSDDPVSALEDSMGVLMSAMKRGDKAAMAKAFRLASDLTREAEMAEAMEEAEEYKPEEDEEEAA